MTQTCRLPVREPVSDILPGAARLGLEPRAETLLCRAAFLYEWICDSLTMSCPKIKESHRRHIAPDTAIGSLLLRPVPGRFHPTFRARVGVCGGVRIRDAPRSPWKGFTVWPFGAEHGKQGASLSEGKCEPSSSEDIQRLPGSQRVFARSPRSMANDFPVPPSQRHRETARRWLW